MDTTITTTTNQNLSSTNVHTLSISSNNSSTVDSVQTVTASSFTKNKRKNFNPRYSAMTDDKNFNPALRSTDQQQQSTLSTTQNITEHFKSVLATTVSSASSLSLDSVPILQRRAPFRGQETVITDDDDYDDVVKNKITNTTTAITTFLTRNPTEINSPLYVAKSALALKDLSKSSNLDSSNTVCATNWRQLFELHRQAAVTSTATATTIPQNSNQFNESCKMTNVANFPVGAKPSSYQIGSCNNSTPGQTIPGDPQAKIEFAYNAFNAVQELLNVYGLSISPGDIVDTFKKQTIGGCPQPPTPPRTPVSAAATTLQISSSTSGENTTNGFFGVIPSSSSSSVTTLGYGASQQDNHLIELSQSAKECAKPNITSDQFPLNNVKQSSFSSSSQLPTSTSSPVVLSTITASQKSPAISLAPITKLMGIKQQDFQQQFECSINPRKTNAIEEEHQHHQQNAENYTSNETKKASNMEGDNGSGRDYDDEDGNNDKFRITENMDNDNDVEKDEDNMNCENVNAENYDSNNEAEDHDQGDKAGVVDDVDDDDEHEQRRKCKERKMKKSRGNRNRCQELSTYYNDENGENVHDNLSDTNISPQPQFNDNAVGNDEDSNVSTTADLHSYDGSDDLGSYSGAPTNPTDYDSTSTTNTTRLSVKNVESLWDKCSLGLFSPFLQLTHMQPEDKQIHAESVKNLTKFSSYIECNNDQCQIENLREHYHCYDEPCFGKILSKKEEIIRHMKWHKKRNESLNHGFLRFSSSDDCSATFGLNCTHNRKQTHYHCFQPNCDKVYISTSDVQMHSNYHRKDSAIFLEGFQRYRATEECNVDYCIFSGQRTTHFHCRRNNCRFTFKNKADMEKHKSYHIKDLQLARDGFKKFLKTEACPFEQCRFSRICNHIHCVRENCYYVLHSSGQLLSHKRKHERMDTEQAYRRFRMIQKSTVLGQDNSQSSRNFELNSKAFTPSTPPLSTISPDLQVTTVASNTLTNTSLPSDFSVACAASAKSENSDIPALKKTDNNPIDLSTLCCNSNLPLEILQEMQQRQQQYIHQMTTDDVETKQLSLITSLIPPVSTNSSSQNNKSIVQDNVLMSMMLNSNNFNDENGRLNIEALEHVISQYFTDNCSCQISNTTASSASEQTKLLQQQTEPLNLNLKNSSVDSKANIIDDKGYNESIECFLNTNEAHLHCLVKDCEAVILRNFNDIIDHMQMHKLNRNVESIMQNSNLLQITSIDGFFNRKRGRPPKNRVVEVYNNNTQQSPQAIFTSFKLEKNVGENLSPSTINPQNQLRSLTSTSTITTQSTCVNNNSANISLSEMNQQHDCLHPKTSIASSSYSSTNRPFSCSASMNTTSFEKKFRLFEHNENCGVDYCTYAQQMHFHCTVGDCCRFVTRFGRAMDVHMLECHANGNEEFFSNLQNWMNNPKIMEIFQYFDAQDDCDLDECNNKRLRSHFHCTKCRKAAVSPEDLQAHLCTCNHSSSMKPSSLCYDQNFCQNRSHEDSGGSVGSSNSNSKKSTAEENELESQVKSESSEDEHVSVVRASGTYFPQNSDINDQTILLKTNESLQQSQSENICQQPFCKLKKKSHDHCDFCNQAFPDKMRLKLHRIKHSTTKLGQIIVSELNKVEKKSSTEKEMNSIIAEGTKGINNCPEQSLDQPQDLSLINCNQQLQKMNPSSSSFITPQVQSTTGLTNSLQQTLPQNFMDNFCIQNLHLAQMALYQQNPFYYQNFYPFLGSQSLPLSQTELFKLQFELPSTNKIPNEPTKPDLLPGQFPFTEVAAVAAAAAAATASTSTSKSNISSSMTSPENFTSQKRKCDGYGSLMETIPPKKFMKASKQGNFKIFKDEPIPHGYLKFRFNEDCNFPNCGYRNHQSHFHCCRNDCFYSFCDKTRFVQHTARHERLDKLMGDDFKQYRANMRCGYEECVYNKNIAGQNNKSSHFHCLKCKFICSDTNKVVAHRRQHSKMEFIRMAGFRKVANNEKCTKSDGDSSCTECTYSLKQTHYHCLVCDCSVLSRAQLGSHRHRVS